jgi:alanyl-tRNA synthetase
VFKQGNIIVHLLNSVENLKVGDEVRLEVNGERRLQLAQHHTATHIINAAARKVLGKHVQQAGAKKDIDKAHIDITHYESISDEQIREIEKEANAVVQADIPLKLMFMARDDAEKRFGMDIYQGGAVPGKELRIVMIPDVDVESCGGTHLHSTKEAEEIKILKASKIQDGIVRLTFTAGGAAKKTENQYEGVLERVATLLQCKESQLPARVEELFQKWKRVVKKKQELSAEEKKLTSAEEYQGNVLVELSRILKTPPEHVHKTVERFLKELNG